MRDKANRRGETALVTGGSGGIGLSLARVFASDGYDLILSARPSERLEKACDEISRSFPVDVLALPADLSKGDGATRLLRSIEEQGATVDVLVNNAGYGGYGPFAGGDPAETLGMIQVNVNALAELTRALLPSMIERSRGGVLNVASVAAFLPGPLMATYYATKAFVLSFSEALAEELKGTGVTVTVLCPGPTPTGFGARAGARSPGYARWPSRLSADDVARAGYRAFRRGKTVAVPGIRNAVVPWIPRLLPRRWVTALVARAQRKRNR